MTTDKSWMDIKYRFDPIYQRGVDTFIDLAFERTKSKELIFCPCIKCCNRNLKNRKDVKDDLTINGILRGYKVWSFHGESLRPVMEDVNIVEDVHAEHDHDEVDELIANTFPGVDQEVIAGELGDLEGLNGMSQSEAQRMYRMLENYKTKIYPGCDVSLLTFILKLLHIKCVSGMSNKGFTMLLQELKKTYPKGETLPKSYYEAKKFFQDLGHTYVKIDACVNDCVLFRKDLVNAVRCPVCDEPRWKTVASTDENDVENLGHGNCRKKVARKILRHFPLKPRLQKMFMSSKIAADMRWHHDKRVNDGILRHPADSKAWKHLDNMHPTFSEDPRNVRLGLASDGFNPFGNMSLSYSIWPVVLMPYNLPPWICMKQSNMILSLLIPGEKAPGNDIDVYLAPLIEELKELWEDGIETYDVSTGKNFQMHAALLWTISDFPGYAVLSGWSTKGFLACPVCNVETSSERLQNGKKQCYMCHRRFLPENHRWRNNKSNFNGEKENRPPPKLLSGEDILRQLHDIDPVVLGKRKKPPHQNPNHNWKKKSIFFDLPYWKTLLIRHNLDVMHIEKNVCDNLVGTLLGIAGKTKDNLNSRLDMQQLNIRADQHPIQTDDNVYNLPAAKYTMSPAEKTSLLQFLRDLKVPDGFSSNVSRCANVKEKKLVGMKSHDCHVLIQRLLPLAVRGLLNGEVCDAVIGVSSFFLGICSKTLRIEDLEALDKHAANTLCLLETLFPPSFFDIMVHLPIHLAYEALLAGPVQYRWMYSIERYLHTLKSYVRNKSRPEGSIAEGYILNECITFCSRYLHDIETQFNKAARNDEGPTPDSSHERLPIFTNRGKPLGKSTIRELSYEEREQVHLYVLQNCTEVQPFIERHKEIIASTDARNLDSVHRREFANWFKSQVLEMQGVTPELREQLRKLSVGPDKMVLAWKGYLVNGFKFHTKGREKELRSQNSGVVVHGDNGIDSLDYYEVLIDVVEVQYRGDNRVTLFKCDWRDIHSQGRGIDIDKYDFISVNPERVLQTNEPFVLATQCEQIFYVKDNVRPNWLVVVEAQPREFFDMPEQVDEALVDEDDALQNIGFTSIPIAHSSDDIVSWHRNDIPAERVSVQNNKKQKKRKRN